MLLPLAILGANAYETFGDRVSLLRREALLDFLYDEYYTSYLDARTLEHDETAADTLVRRAKMKLTCAICPNKWETEEGKGDQTNCPKCGNKSEVFGQNTYSVGLHFAKPDELASKGVHKFTAAERAHANKWHLANP
jgi:ribosomal protein S27E